MGLTGFVLEKLPGHNLRQYPTLSRRWRCMLHRNSYWKWQSPQRKKIKLFATELLEVVMTGARLNLRNSVDICGAKI